MQALLDGAPLSRGAGQDTGQGSGTVRGEPAEQSRLPALAGLDPVVVEAARKAGVPEDQLVRMSRLAGQGPNVGELRPSLECRSETRWASQTTGSTPRAVEPH